MKLQTPTRRSNLPGGKTTATDSLRLFDLDGGGKGDVGGVGGGGKGDGCSGGSGGGKGGGGAIYVKG